MLLDINKLAKSFKHAVNGLKESLRTEQNLRIEIFCSLLVIIAGVYFKLKTSEWTLVLSACFFVIFGELINTSVEKLTDLVVDKRKTRNAKKAKDIAASAVLLASLYALIIGLIVFLPKFL